MSDFNKVVRIGEVEVAGKRCHLYCNVVFTYPLLSITGVEGPLRNGNSVGGCGQVINHEWAVVRYAPGWDGTKLEHFRAVWSTYHLNDRNAGSPDQMAFLSMRPDLIDYEGCLEALRAVGLSPDPNYIHEGKPFEYGSDWLFTRVPYHVLAFLQSLPDTDIEPAWV